MTSILTKKLQPEIEDIFILAVYYNLSGIVMALILMLITERNSMSFPDDAENITYFSIHTMSKLISSFSYQIALYFGSAVACTLTLNANLTLNALCEYVLFPSLQPLGGGNWVELTGIAVVTIGILVCPLVEIFVLCRSNRTHDSEEQKQLIEQKN